MDHFGLDIVDDALGNTFVEIISDGDFVGFVELLIVVVLWESERVGLYKDFLIIINNNI